MWWLAAAWADCVETERSALVARAVEGERAFQEAEPDVVTEQATAALRDLPCVHERLGATDVGAIYRLFGYAAFIDRRLDDARGWFAASRAAEPAYTFPPDLLPAGHPILALYAEDFPADAVRVRGEAYVDGVPNRTRPAGRPSIVQQPSAAGLETTVLTPSAPVPGSAPHPGLRVGVLAAGGVQRPGDAAAPEVGLLVRADAPLAGAARLEAGLRAVAAPENAGGERFLRVFPAAVLGAGWLAPASGARGSLGAWGGPSQRCPSEGCSAADPGALTVVAGPYLAVGVDRRWFSAELRGGWLDGPAIGVGVGAHWSRR